MSVFFVVAVIFRVAVTKDKGAGNGKQASVEWLKFEEGLEKSKAQKQLLVVDFYTNWCHWCKVMDKETYGNPDVIEFSKDKIAYAKINAESSDKVKFQNATYSGREMAMMFGVQGYPSTSFMNEKGELITTVSGYIKPDQFINILKFISGKHYETLSFEDFLKQQGSKNEG
jgi:thioredoxin-related protein